MQTNSKTNEQPATELPVETLDQVSAAGDSEAQTTASSIQKKLHDTNSAVIGKI